MYLHLVSAVDAGRHRVQISNSRGRGQRLDQPGQGLRHLHRRRRHRRPAPAGQDPTTLKPPRNVPRVARDTGCTSRTGASRDQSRAGRLSPATRSAGTGRPGSHAAGQPAKRRTSIRRCAAIAASTGARRSAMCSVVGGSPTTPATKFSAISHSGVGDSSSSGSRTRYSVCVSPSRSATRQILAPTAVDGSRQYRTTSHVGHQTSGRVLRVRAAVSNHHPNSARSRHICASSSS